MFSEDAPAPRDQDGKSSTSEMDGLRKLKDVKQVAADREKDVETVLPFWRRG